MPRNLDYPAPMHGRMMRQRLWETQLDAGMLYDTLRDDDAVPAWTLDKVARGADNIHQVSRYLRFKVSHPQHWGAPDAPAAAPVTLPEVADKPFYEAILRGLEAPVTANTLALIYAWRQTEGGKATYNPFNTTKKMPGSTRYKTNVANVQNYTTPQQGVDATVATMLLPYYTSVIQLLRADATPVDVANAIIASPWGTKGLLLDVLRMYGKGKVVVAPIATVPGAPAISTLAAAPAAPGAKKPRVRYEKPPTNWLAIGGIAMLAAAVILLPALLQGGSKAATPSLPAPPKANPHRRSRRRRR
jgi:hypothetical protein